MNKNYSKERYRELLKYAKDLSKQGKSLAKESEKDYSELQIYLIMVGNQLNWKMQNEYLELFEKFFEGKITCFELCEILDDKVKLNDELSDTLEFNVIDQKAEKFTNFLQDLLSSWELYDGDSDYYENDMLPGHINKKQLEEEIRQTFFDLKKIIEE